MARKARQRISYGKLLFQIALPYIQQYRLIHFCVAVLPLANSPGGHRLGVNGLAVDAERSIL